MWLARSSTLCVTERSAGDEDVNSVAFQQRGSFALRIVCCCGNDAAHALKGEDSANKESTTCDAGRVGDGPADDEPARC